MELEVNQSLFDKRTNAIEKSPGVKWFKEWVPQEVVATGGKCYLLKWVTEDKLKAIKEKYREPEQDELQAEPEPSTEVLFLCSYEGCGKTFIDAGALRKHSHIHGERQYVCHYDGCGKKFLDSSKLKRHFLIHTGERDYICPHEGCGKAFSLDFNLRAHMRTHSQENYHVCPYVDCGKRYAHEYKLKTHIKTHHEKHAAATTDTVKHTQQAEKSHSSALKTPVSYGSASSDRPYTCPYEGCEKAYIHEYKLNLHLRREHPGHNAEENGKQADMDNDIDEGSDQDTYVGKGNKNKKRLKTKPASKKKTSKIAHTKGSSGTQLRNNIKLQWSARDAYRDEDSEETEEEDRDNGDRWKYTENNEDDEETEYED